MILIVGLGNSGQKFRNTRHNLGFEIVDYLKKEGDFSAWRNKKKLKAKISQGKIEKQNIILAKPQTFMNQSGEAVKLLIKFYKVPLKNLWVIHDDLDLTLGKIKIKKGSQAGRPAHTPPGTGSGAGGHKGVQSIIDELKTKNFNRLKIGIGPAKVDSKKFVLQKFSKTEREILKQSEGKAIINLLSHINGRNKNNRYQQPTISRGLKENC